MSWVSKTIGSIVGTVASVLGLAPSAPAAPAPAPTAPTADNSYATMDTAAQQQAAAVSRGRTSTMLTGAAGEDETKLNTSKVLLGQ